MRRAHGAQVVRGFEAAQPCQLVDLVEFLAGSATHVNVERLRLVDPFLAARRTFDQPRRIHLEGRRIERADFRRHAVDLGQRAVEIFHVRDHHFIPQVEALQILDQEFIGDGELAGQVRFDVEVLIGRLDALRQPGNVGDGRRRRDRDAVRVAHADLPDARAQRLPIHGD